MKKTYFYHNREESVSNFIRETITAEIMVVLLSSSVQTFFSSYKISHDGFLSPIILYRFFFSHLTVEH